MIDVLLVFVVTTVAVIWICERKFQIGDAWIIIWMPVLSGTMLLTSGYVSLFYEKVWRQRVVTEIGGCNRNTCGVRFDDGSIGELEMPVVGQRVEDFSWKRK